MIKNLRAKVINKFNRPAPLFVENLCIFEISLLDNLFYRHLGGSAGLISLLLRTAWTVSRSISIFLVRLLQFFTLLLSIWVIALAFALMCLLGWMCRNQDICTNMWGLTSFRSELIKFGHFVPFACVRRLFRLFF